MTQRVSSLSGEERDVRSHMAAAKETKSKLIVFLLRQTDVTKV